MELSEREKIALKRFRVALEEVFTNNLIEIKLFGSKARGEGRNDSDLDMLVVISSDDWRICDVVYGIATDILLEYEVCISPKTLRQEEYIHLNNIGSTFIKNVVRDGIQV